MLQYIIIQFWFNFKDNWREQEIGSAAVTPHGTMTLKLAYRTRVDMTVDRAVRVINLKVRIH